MALLLLLTGLSPAAEKKPSFEQDVRPVLKAYCLDCHGGGEKLKGKLDLRLQRFAVKGGSSGPAVVPGDPAKSPLVERMRSGEMPPTEKKVPAELIAAVERWVAAGAPALRDEPASLPPGIDITPQERAYWFYQPLRRPQPPRFAAGDGGRTPIDAFVLTKLREKGLSFNDEADRLTLLLRATLDLTGLPPSPAEAEAFLGDRSPLAYERLVDRLLASPAYGERWGRHWLDAAGYADSEGDGTTDTPRPHAWKYRDWVVRALNADKPYDRFVVEQMAGDELTSARKNLTPEQIDLLTATGFLRNAPAGTAAGGGEAEAQQVVADTLKVVGSALLGLTVGCAQCHDHRYDPIPQADYYRLRAVFEPALDPARWRRPGQRRLSLYTDADRAKAAVVEAEASKLQAEYNAVQDRHMKAAFEKVLGTFPADQRERLGVAFRTPEAKRTAEMKQIVASNPKLNITPGVLYQYNPAAAEELKKLAASVAAKRAEKPAEDFVAVLDEVPGQVPTTKIFHRGDYRQPKGEVKPGDLTIAAPDGHRLEVAAKAADLPTTGRRLAFARHLTNGQHPLFGRVLANRLWQHHFGRGIVDTPGDFGVLGQRPTHPDLLDWLATEVARQGWSLKRTHRLMLTSAVYRQSSQRDRTKDAIDPAGALYSRFPLRRLEAEALRDRILAVTRRLDRSMFGPAVPVAEDFVGQVVAPDDRPRRSLYLQARRSKPLAFLTTFDAPAGELTCDKRTASTAAPQALMLMNSEFILQQSRHFAGRLLAEAPGSARDRVALAWRLAYLRNASPEELDLASRFVQRQALQLRGAVGQDAERAALTNLCQQLLASNEILYVP
ncbi:MAG: PSD1 and planctomycete cytochrome C domain-containing protein [Gemmataceae bacterium]